jgi:hypothetical protein
MIVILLRCRLLHPRVHSRGIAVRIICRIIIAVIVLMLRLGLAPNCGVRRLLIREIRAVLFFVLEKRHFGDFSQ